MIILHDKFTTFHCYEVTKQNIPNIFISYTYVVKKNIGPWATTLT